MTKQFLKTLLVYGLLLAFIGSLPVFAAQAKKADKEILKNIKYREIGPTRESGRFVDIAWNEKEPNTFYCATGSGGLWKTTNNGISFEALFTNEPVFSLGDVEVAPSDPSIVWVGTGKLLTPGAPIGETVFTNQPMPGKPGLIWDLMNPIILELL